MLKKLLFVMAIATLFVSCNQESNNELATLTVAEFQKVAPEYIDQEIKITGMVNHVCQNSGKRLFIIEGDEDNSIKIVPDENNISSFEADIEGNEYVFTGVVVEDYKIDEAFLAEWEKEIIAHNEEELAKEEEGENKEGEEIEEVAEDVEEVDVIEIVEETETEEVAEEEIEHEHAEETDGHAHVHKDEEGQGDGAGHGDHHLKGMEKVEKYRKMLAESGKDEIIIYMVKCSNFELTEQE